MLTKHILMFIHFSCSFCTMLFLRDWLKDCLKNLTLSLSYLRLVFSPSEPLCAFTILLFISGSSNRSMTENACLIFHRALVVELETIPESYKVIHAEPDISTTQAPTGLHQCLPLATSKSRGLTFLMYKVGSNS